MIDILIAISIIGLALSAIVHFCSLLNIYNPPRVLIILLNVGMIVVLCSACIVSNKMRHRCSIEDCKKDLYNTCPRWLRIMNGLFIIYALAGLIYSCFVKLSNGAEVFHGFTGYWMAVYSLAIVILYSCKRLQNGKKHFLD
jgi:hypothetical protein